ncbi:MAG: polyprenyl synthetase family protein [Alphaproteobacteria bacterium]|nr:polyprenyl synthetase family protein [Alphaproteobacteria bacterium]
MSDFITELKLFSNRFNDKLPALFEFVSGQEKRVAEAMFYSLANGGKRLRPFLVMKTAEIFGVDFEKSFITAAALECLHTYSLIHDDLPAMDNDDLRRGKPTCHKKFDEATAILAGDGLLTFAFDLISGEKNPLDDKIKCLLVQKLAKAAGAFGGMVAGQMLDLYMENCGSVDSPENVIRHIEEMKTGCLLKFACEAGAILGNADEEKYQALLLYSRKIGIAFQITDDILDVEGDEIQMGKTLGKDALQDKLTFVGLYGLDKAKQMAQQLIDEAKNVLAIFGDNAKVLCELADFIVSRKH